MDKIKILLELMSKEKMNPILSDLRPQKQNSGMDRNKLRAREILLRVQMAQAKHPLPKK